MSQKYKVMEHFEIYVKNVYRNVLITQWNKGDIINETDMTFAEINYLEKDGLIEPITTKVVFRWVHNKEILTYNEASCDWYSYNLFYGTNGVFTGGIDCTALHILVTLGAIEEAEIEVVNE